ncbi:MAG: capsule biosynthesis protein [Sulfitobacter sp.]
MSDNATPASKPPPPPPAQPSYIKPRHKGLLLSFIVIVCLPVLVAVWYLNVRAADQYASYLGFSVRTEESSSAVEILGGITELSGSSSSDTDILYAYLTSHELVRRIDNEVDLRAIWSRVSTTQDPVFAYDPTGTIEDLVEYWEDMVGIVYDNGTGMLDLQVLSFDPTDSRRIAEALLEECTAMINNLSAIAREDAIKYAREELDVAVARLKTARLALTAFRNRTQIVDPVIDTQGQMGLLNTLQQQLAAALIEQDLLAETARNGDPRVVQAQRRVEVIEARIAAERQKLGLGENAEGSAVFATLVGEYEGLIVDREFAETAYTSALAAYDASQAEARKQSRYLAAHIRPTLAEKAEYPERGILILLMSVFLLFGWAILALIYYSLRDRR